MLERTITMGASVKATRLFIFICYPLDIPRRIQAQKNRRERGTVKFTSLIRSFSGKGMVSPEAKFTRLFNFPGKPLNFA